MIERYARPAMTAIWTDAGKLDRWLAVHDVETPQESAESEHARVGVGIYYFEERLDAPGSERESP